MFDSIHGVGFDEFVQTNEVGPHAGIVLWQLGNAVHLLIGEVELRRVVQELRFF